MNFRVGVGEASQPGRESVRRGAQWGREPIHKLETRVWGGGWRVKEEES